MRDRPTVVINTGPLLALIAAIGDLELLRTLYARVVVPFEVAHELKASPHNRFGSDVVERTSWLVTTQQPTAIQVLLRQSLDPGEAAVIQLAMDEQVPLVCIDELAGRRVARLSGLKVTGSLGVLLRALSEGLEVDVSAAMRRMKSHGIWLSDRVVREVRRLEEEIQAKKFQRRNQASLPNDQ